MASSKVMASTSPPNPDLPRQPSSSIYQPHHHNQLNPLLLQTSNDHSRSFGGSMNVDDFLKNIYSDSENFPSEVDVVSGGPAVENGGKGKMLEEVWGEIASSGGGAGGIGSGSGVIRETEMTLEDFLTKAGAVSEEDVRVPVAPPPPTPPHPPPVAEEMVDGFVVETMMNGAVQFPPGMHMQNGPPGGFGVEAVPLAFANGNEMVAVSGGAGVNNGRRRRRVDDAQIDKASQQKQRRMIKNRESAARSRERKQAYTIELESLVAQLEEENARLVKEEAEWKKQRLKQLLESLVPVEEKQKPPRVLRRVNSVSW